MKKVLILCVILFACSLSACDKDRSREVRRAIHDSIGEYIKAGIVISPYADSAYPKHDSVREYIVISPYADSARGESSRAVYPDDRLYITGVYIDSVIDSVTHGAYDRYYPKQPLRMKIDTVRVDTVDLNYGGNLWFSRVGLQVGSWWFEPILRYTIDTSYYLTKEQRKILEEK